MDFISYETAVRLKEAGFPQPAPETGQVWYDGNEEIYFIHCMEDPYVYGVFVRDDHKGFCQIPKGYEIFAPTATDILRELGDAKLECISGKLRAYENLYANFAENENAAEALAELWFAQREREV